MPSHRATVPRIEAPTNRHGALSHSIPDTDLNAVLIPSQTLLTTAHNCLKCSQNRRAARYEWHSLAQFGTLFANFPPIGRPARLSIRPPIQTRSVGSSNPPGAAPAEP